jgi:hypothetical protein
MEEYVGPDLGWHLPSWRQDHGMVVHVYFQNLPFLCELLYKTLCMCDIGVQKRDISAHSCD